MYKRLFLLLLFFVSFSTQASHLLGGEVTYRCLGNGLYRFTVTVYRDCSGISFNQTSVTLSGPVVVVCPLVTSSDITPIGTGSSGNIRCNPPATYNASKGGISKFVYEGTADLSSLTVTPSNGYVWSTANIPCCRNSSNNSNCTGDMILRVVMHRFVNEQNVALSPAALCDDSPVFSVLPNAVHVVNSHDTMVVNHSGQDKNNSDEIRYFLDLPWTSVGIPCSYNQGYSQANPFPGLIGPVVDSLTGLTTFRPLLAGTFQSAVRMESRRCGQLISTVYRDFQMNIINNPASARPLFNPSAPATDQQYQQKAPFFVSLGSWPDSSRSHQLTIYAGDTLIFPIQAYDVYPLFDPPTSQNPTPFYNPDSVAVFVSSKQLGANGTSATAGCESPPCATIRQGNNLAAQPMRYSANAEVMGYGFAGIQQVSAELFWVPGCSAAIDTLGASCQLAAKTYLFSLVSMDDAYPLRGINSRLLRISVIGAPEVAAPTFRQLSLDPTGRQVTLSWSQFIDTSSIDPVDQANFPNASQAELRNKSVQRRLSAFGGIEVQRANQNQGIYTTLAVISDIHTLSWVDTTVLPGQSYFYRLASVNACTDKRNFSEELKTLRLTFAHNWTTGAAELSWDSLTIGRLVPATFTGQVVVERENFSVQPAAWQQRANLNLLTQFSEIPQTFGDSLNYRVGLVDSSGLISYSQALGSSFDLDALSLDELESAAFQLYPNPADNLLHLKLAQLISGNIQLKVYDMRGRLVVQKQLKLNNESLMTLEITDLTPGVYQLRLEQPNQKTTVKRFVKR